MARLSKAERDARAFLEGLKTPAPAETCCVVDVYDATPRPSSVKTPLKEARKRLQKKTDKRHLKKKPPKTPAQKKAQTETARQKAAAKRGMTLTLKAPHWINGIAYGPGVVHNVPPDLAAGLLEDERRVEYNNQRFDGAQAAFIGPTVDGRPGYSARQVPMQLMDSPMLNVLEAFTLQ